MQRVNLPFFVTRVDSAAQYVDDFGDLLDLIVDQSVDDPDYQTFSEALQDDWNDEDHRLEVFGPHFTEETLKDTLDLCEAVEAMNKGYIL